MASHASNGLKFVHNTRLGTLNYLPREIRDIIYALVLEDYLHSEDAQLYFKIWGHERPSAALACEIDPAWTSSKCCAGAEGWPQDMLKSRPL